MKLLTTYQNLKKKSVELLSKGFLDEYFDTLVVLSNIEKQLSRLHYLN